MNTKAITKATVAILTAPEQRAAIAKYIQDHPELLLPPTAGAPDYLAMWEKNVASMVTRGQRISNAWWNDVLQDPQWKRFLSDTSAAPPQDFYPLPLFLRLGIHFPYSKADRIKNAWDAEWDQMATATAATLSEVIKHPGDW